jgi:hypothetical protein
MPAAFGWAYTGGLWAVPAAASDDLSPPLSKCPSSPPRVRRSLPLSWRVGARSAATPTTALVNGQGVGLRPRSGLATQRCPGGDPQWQSHVAIPGNAHPPGTLDLRRDGARGLATHRLDRCVELTRSQAALMARNFDYGGRCDRPFLDGSPRRLIPALNPCI